MPGMLPIFTITNLIKLNAIRVMKNFTMKIKSALVAGLLSMSFLCYAQNNMFLGSPQLSPLAVNYPSTHSIGLSFGVQFNYTVNALNANQIAITITLGRLQGSAAIASAATGNLATKMNWSYNAVTNALVGRWKLNEQFLQLTSYTIAFANLPAMQFVPEADINLGFNANLVPPFGVTDPSTTNNATSRFTFHVGNCDEYQSVSSGLFSNSVNWQRRTGPLSSRVWAAAPTAPPSGAIVYVRNEIVQDVDYTVFNCPLILDDNGASKLTIEPDVTLGFNGGADGNAYFNNRPVVVRSTINGTGAIGTMIPVDPIPGDATTAALANNASKTYGDENVTLERFIPGVKRRWNLLTPGVVNGTTVNTNLTLRDAWGGRQANGDPIPRVTLSNNRNGSTVYELGNPPGGKPENVPHLFYGASSAADLVSNPKTSGYDPAQYVPYDGTLITGHRYKNGTDAGAKGFDWWDELIIPAGSTFYLSPTQTAKADNDRTTPSSIRPYRPNATTDFGPERGTHWVSNSTVNSDPARGGRSIVQLTLNELDNGYMIFTRGDRRVLENWVDSTTLRPVGKIRTGDVQIAVNPASVQALTLVPNPYPAPISLEKLYTDATANNDDAMLGKAHIWDSKIAGSNGFGGWITLTRTGVNTWVAAPSTSGNNPDFISSSEAFMVEGTPAGGNLTFKESMKVDIKTVDYTPFENENASGNVGVLITNFNSRSSNGNLSVIDGAGILLDDAYHAVTSDANDVRKVFNFEGGNSLALVRDGNLLAFDAYPSPVAETVFPLQIGGFEKQKYAFTFKPSALDKEGREAWLKDKFLGIESPISLTDPSQYNFEGTSDAASMNPNRFEIVFKQGEILPVTFTSINAVEQGKNIKVTWNVATEDKMSHYEVEHSTNGTEFGKAVKVDAKNTSPAAYDWLHLQPGNGDHFYRVRAFNLEGRSLLTKVVKVTLGDNAPGFKAFPTVVSATRQVTLQLISLDKGTYTVQVTDMAGKVISARTIEHNGGSASMIMQMPPSLSAGKYNIRLTGTGGNFVQPVVKD